MSSKHIRRNHRHSGSLPLLEDAQVEQPSDKVGEDRHEQTERGRNKRPQQTYEVFLEIEGRQLFVGEVLAKNAGEAADKAKRIAHDCVRRCCTPPTLIVRYEGAESHFRTDDVWLKPVRNKHASPNQSSLLAS